MRMKIVFPGGARVDAQLRDAVVRTDQRPGHGGEGSAPAPFDYFLASIGTCAGVYVLKFLEQRKLPTEGVHLEVETKTDRERGMVSDIAINVVLPESFPSRYASAVIRAVDLCSVKKHLAEPPRFRTTIEIGGTVAADSDAELRDRADASGSTVTTA